MRRNGSRVHQLLYTWRLNSERQTRSDAPLYQPERVVGRIICQIKRERVKAVFLENVTDQRSAKRIADETGAKIGSSLYSDAR